MQRERSELAVGLTVLAALGVFLFSSFQLGSCAFSGGGAKHIVAHFDDAAGVTPRTEVQIAGVRVGAVESIDLDGGRARITLRIDDGTLAIPLDSTVVIRSRGLLGERVVALEPGEAQRLAKDGDALTRTREAPNLDAMLETLATVSHDIREVTGSLRLAMGGSRGQENVMQIVDDIRDVARQMKGFMDENEASLTRVVTNLDTASGNLETFSEALAGLADEGQTVSELLENFRSASSRMEVAVDQLARVSSGLERGEGTLGRLLKDDELYTKLDTSFAELQRTLTEVRRAAEEAQEQLPVTVLGSVVGSLF